MSKKKTKTPIQIARDKYKEFLETKFITGSQVIHSKSINALFAYLKNDLQNDYIDLFYKSFKEGDYRRLVVGVADIDNNVEELFSRKKLIDERFEMFKTDDEEKCYNRYVGASAMDNDTGKSESNFLRAKKAGQEGAIREYANLKKMDFEEATFKITDFYVLVERLYKLAELNMTMQDLLEQLEERCETNLKRFGVSAKK